MIVYGKQVVIYVLEKHSNLIEEIFFSKDIDKKLFIRFSKLGKKITKLDNKKAQSLAKGGNHQGFFLRLKEFEYTPFKTIKDMNFILVLDGLTDVGNIGAISRTAYSLGVDAIVASNVKTLNNPGLIRTSLGGILDLPFGLFHNCLDLVNELKQYDFTLIGTTLHGTNLKEFKIPNKGSKIALFLGNESKGLSKKILKKVDLQVSIDMKGKFDSLNVSVAAGIFIYNLKK